MKVGVLRTIRRDGLRLCVTTAYLPDESRPCSEDFRFQCTLEITNGGACPVEVIFGDWSTTDALLNQIENKGADSRLHRVRLPQNLGFSRRFQCHLPTPIGQLGVRVSFIRPDGQKFDFDMSGVELSAPNHIQ